MYTHAYLTSYRGLSAKFGHELQVKTLHSVDLYHSLTRLNEKPNSPIKPFYV